MNEIFTTRVELQIILNDLTESQKLLESLTPYPEGPVNATGAARAILENMLEAATD